MNAGTNLLPLLMHVLQRGEFVRGKTRKSYLLLVGTFLTTTSKRLNHIAIFDPDGFTITTGPMLLLTRSRTIEDSRREEAWVIRPHDPSP